MNENENERVMINQYSYSEFISNVNNFEKEFYDDSVVFFLVNYCLFVCFLSSIIDYWFADRIEKLLFFVFIDLTIRLIDWTKQNKWKIQFEWWRHLSVEIDSVIRSIGKKSIFLQFTIFLDWNEMKRSISFCVINWICDILLFREKRKTKTKKPIWRLIIFDNYYFCCCCY